MARTVNVKQKVITYKYVRVDLLEHIKKCQGEFVANRESQCLDIRFPTKWEGCTNYVGHIPYTAMTETVEELRNRIQDGSIICVIEQYIDEVVWSGGV